MSLSLTLVTLLRLNAVTSMNSDDEIRRLKRFIIVSWTLLLTLFLGLVLWGSLEIRQFNETVRLTVSREPRIIQGLNGLNGLPGMNGQPGAQGNSGVNGNNGNNGQDGQSITPEEIAQAVSSYLQENPVPSVQGAMGTTGQDGKDLQIQLDTKSCELESKYSTDDDWSSLAQLPIPCTAQDTQ